MIEIEYNNQQVMAALQKLQKASNDLSPALLEIGEMLTKSSKQRFVDKQSPDGSAWADNKDSTIARKGRNHPLTGETGNLMEYLLTISFRTVIR